MSTPTPTPRTQSAGPVSAFRSGDLFGFVICPGCGDQTAPGTTAEDQHRTCPKCSGSFFYWGRWDRITSIEPFKVDICYVSEPRSLPNAKVQPVGGEASTKTKSNERKY